MLESFQMTFETPGVYPIMTLLETPARYYIVAGDASLQEHIEARRSLGAGERDGRRDRVHAAADRRRFLCLRECDSCIASMIICGHRRCAHELAIIV